MKYIISIMIIIGALSTGVQAKEKNSYDLKLEKYHQKKFEKLKKRMISRDSKYPELVKCYEGMNNNSDIKKCKKKFRGYKTKKRKEEMEALYKKAKPIISK